MLKRTLYDVDHEQFRDSVRSFVEQEMVPNADKWERAGIIDKSLFTKAGSLGFLGIEVDERYGGGGVNDWRFNCVINEEIQRAGMMGVGGGFMLHIDVTLPYFIEWTDDDQKARWLPRICSGEAITAIAMTEPGIGSDLAGMATTAVRDGDDYIINGSKTFITNGINSELVIVAVKTDPSQKHRGMSLIVVEDGTPGFTRGRNLDKVGQHAQDTAELFFDDVRVPATNLLDAEGQGFVGLVKNLPRERLSLAITGLYHAKAAFDWTVEYVKERTAFGQPIASFQNTKFELAEMKTELDIGQVFLDRQIEAYLDGELTPEVAAEAKWWITDLECRTIDRCLQLFGGYGYMEEYPIAKAYRDARVQRIYGGTNEIMKEIIGRSVLA